MNNFEKFLNGLPQDKIETPKADDSLLNPFAMRDATNPVCSKCKRSTQQNYIVADRRGNFQHGATKVKLRTVGTVCECDIMTA